MPFAILSKYRAELMGVATLWVMLFHFRANMHVAPLDGFSSIGYGGVDIFLFLSGFGLSCGYGKHKSVWQFYGKRFLRVYPFYLIVIVVHSLLKQEYNPIRMVMQSLGVGYFLPFVAHASYEWYVPTIMAFYLLFPVIYKMLNVNLTKWGG